MSYFDYHGNQLYYEEYGSGEPLLLLHGNTVSGRFFAPVIPMFADKYHVMVPDFLGCGRSDRISKWPTDLWYEWSRQAMALCESKRLNNINVIGCSGGALAAINMALEYPQKINAVIADSFEGLCANPDITDQICDGRHFAKQEQRFRTIFKAMHGEDWESVVDADTEAIMNHAQKIGNFVHKPIEKLSVKLFLTGSAEDEMFPRGHYHELFDGICSKTDAALFRIFEHGGHPAMMSNSEAFIVLCDQFFER